MVTTQRFSRYAPVVFRRMVIKSSRLVPSEISQFLEVGVKMKQPGMHGQVKFHRLPSSEDASDHKLNGEAAAASSSDQELKPEPGDIAIEVCLLLSVGYFC